MLETKLKYLISFDQNKVVGRDDICVKWWE